MTLILGIESSCDETGVAIYDSENGLLANTLYSQIDLHRQYGGVVPELASRDHLRKIIPLIDEALINAKKTLNEIDAIAFTAGPGLNGALLIGATVANSIAFANKIPLIPVHHLEGHILSPILADKNLAPPFVALLVSGGHSQIIAVEKIGSYHILGDTLDDASGEAFDKTAKMLGLPYPGGRYIAELARHGKESYPLPRPMLNSGNLTMSFSGLKTAVLTLIQNLEKQQISIEGQVLADIAKSIEEAITDVLVKKSMMAIKETGIKQLVVCGGVSANLTLRNKLNDYAKRHDYRIVYPPLDLCTDNGAMIALAGYYRFKDRQSGYSFSVNPRWDLSSLQIQN
ncbi:tRNA (adenosine(37)-N6)-threonylcarbamoyltransferase complex transferase subunit TsaD [Aquella oligotrophica]|uniref:tRNA N6-adenosine threonylcarbamoyltransferase n=1 Tax=Aquella oligotrophica TaxID=2067065 RepID=A0A2I7N6S9_9NEIS|nr:tRNA (adenosine(37)-N6)-threonylcarbamoyltransferase complex transferase subunit TsaD [Aquella oligotrophica]AUR52173.1 tRNA (adenosine(37)-N6)-threonylcarbamoyltransferase complex transferase subunit TsaD [Aquella oligotrophica]